ncbi:hydrogenase subunit MbhD domain-containing protein [Roseococcus sp. YIM B11640]|uniref:hydrogenase subunit MbhD domain-containing protein n=1 Tax=Roseococcus sp. YIM B11640 TaxID=3133973 RepID=UPI003C7ED93E
MIAGTVLDLVIALAVVGLALWTVAARGVFPALVGFIGLGMMLSLAWIRLGAVDVAMTEAAIGAGATGILLLHASARLAGHRFAAPEDVAGPGVRIAAGCLSALIAGAVGFVLLGLPEPAPSLAPLAAENLARTALGNPVSSALMTWRAIDTLLEAVVVLLAVIAVWSLAPDGAWGRAPGPAMPRQEHGPFALLVRILAPIGIVIGVHIVWTGADAPGGKFQGAAVLAAMWILAWMAGLVRAPRVTSPGLRGALVAGPLLFIAIGALGCLTAEGFLAYPEAVTKPLILLIEAATTVSIAMALALLLVGPPEEG